LTIRQWFYRIRRPAPLSIFRRTSPLSDVWGFDRGTPVDRYYIGRFIEEYRQDIVGRALEVADTEYTSRYGAGVTQADVLDIDRSNKEATLIADLSVPDQIPSSSFDCFILTQTLHLIYDAKSAIEGAYRLLRPGGVLLATLPCVSRIASEATEDCWRFTVPSSKRLFSESFGAENTTVRSYGNLLTCVAFLQGMASEELSHKELAKTDDAFPLLIGVRAVKAK
jgi:SAM-dependent methyltransferase